MGVYNDIHSIDETFYASETNTYNDYFTAHFDEYFGKNKSKTDVYREHLSTASKEKLIDIALEGNKNYQWANNLAWERGLEIEKLNTTINNNEAIYRMNLNNQTKISIGLCIALGLVFIGIISKIGLDKLKNKIRKDLMNELNNNTNCIK